MAVRWSHCYVILAGVLVAVLSLLFYQQVDGAAANEMKFLVGVDDPSLMQGVQVLLIKKDGQMIELGETDGGGALSVDKALLQDKGLVIMFCREGFFCGSFLLSEPRFFDYDERYIKLAPLAWL